MRLGLISAARITDKALIDPAREIDEVELAAVAARGLDRAAEAAAKWGIATAYGSYEELIDDPSIDAVYIATPASHHMRWTIAALDAGKHVLCEKPLTANASEAADVVAAAERSGRIMMEAFHWRYHPIVGQIRAAIDSGAIGDIRRAEGYFNLPVGEISEGDIRWDLSLGGGALMDLGCYPVQWVRWLIGSEPEVVSATAECPVEEVDGFLRAELRWPTGETGAVECSMIAPEDGTISVLPSKAARARSPSRTRWRPKAVLRSRSTTPPAQLV